MVLNPLTEVRLRVLVTVVVSRSQLMMDILRHGKRGEGEKNADHPQYCNGAETPQGGSELYGQGNHDVRRAQGLNVANGTYRPQKVC